MQSHFIHRCTALLAVLTAGAAFAQTPPPTPSQPLNPPAIEKLLVEATVTLGGETIASPRLVAVAGENFSFRIGKEGEQRVSFSGMAAPINDRNMATDFTLELEQPSQLGPKVRRVSQTIKTGNGEPYTVVGDVEGKPLRMVLTVSRAP